MKRAIAAMALTSAFVLSLPTCVSAQDTDGKPQPSSVTMTRLSSTTNCTVGTVDSELRTFTCRSEQSSHSYRVSSSTVFQVGGAEPSFGALKSGMTVRVQYHSSGTTLVAGTALVADTVTAAP